MTVIDYIPPGRLDPADPDYAHKSEVQSFARIAELRFKPLPGDYDAAHLKAVHRHLFQGCSDHHAPGQYRPESDSHLKWRKLEGAAGEYVVRYAPMRDELDADCRINAVLAEIPPISCVTCPWRHFQNGWRRLTPSSITFTRLLSNLTNFITPADRT